MVLDGSKVSLTCGSARFSLQTMPVEDYPALPDMPAATGTVRSDLFAHAVAQAVTAAGRDDMLPVLTGVRIEIEGSTISLLATDRFRLSHRELEWHPSSPDESLAALVPAKVLADTAKSLTAGTEVTIALAASGTGEGIIGFEGSAPGGVRRTTTRLLDGEFPKVRTLFPNEHQTTARVDKAALVESRQARRPGRRAQHRRPARVLRRRAHPRRRLRRRGAGHRVDRGRRSTARTSPPASTRSSCSTGCSVIDEPVVELAFTQADQAGVVRVSGLDGDADSDFRYLLMPRRLALLMPQAGPARPEPRTRDAATEGAAWTSDSSGSARWAATCASRMRNAGHTVVGYDRNPDVSDVGQPRGDGRAAAQPQGGLGDGARRRPDPRHHPGARRPARRGRPGRRRRQLPLDRRPGATPSCSRRRASASSTAASPAASGA